VFWDILRSGIVIIISWGLYNLTASSSHVFDKLNDKYSFEIDALLVPFLSRVLRVIIVMIAISVVAQEFGFPLVIRASYTLGGAGASIVYKKEDFDEHLSRGLEISPIHEVMIDKALLGWKEYELELLRDKNDNVVIICTIENMDPMGIHTGDSITVAPAMTLSDTTFQRMRDMAIHMMRSIGDFAGGCNVQFAVSPDEKEDITNKIIRPKV